MFTQFEKCSGLRVNIDKTLVAKLGTKVKEKGDVCPELGLNYVSEFTLLGIHFSSQMKAADLVNLNRNAVKTVQKTKFVNTWKGNSCKDNGLTTASACVVCHPLSGSCFHQKTGVYVFGIYLE